MLHIDNVKNFTFFYFNYFKIFYSKSCNYKKFQLSSWCISLNHIETSILLAKSVKFSSTFRVVAWLDDCEVLSHLPVAIIINLYDYIDTKRQNKNLSCLIVSKIFVIENAFEIEGERYSTSLLSNNGNNYNQKINSWVKSYLLCHIYIPIAHKIFILQDTHIMQIQCFSQEVLVRFTNFSQAKQLQAYCA